MLRVYVAGPMRGYPQSNFPMFDACRDQLIRMGWDPVSPADMDRKRDGFDPTKPGFDLAAVETFDLRRALKRDFIAIMEADGIVFLPGWEGSSGANVERTLGAALDLRAWLYLPAERVKIRRTAWQVLEDAREEWRRQNG